ncbi:MAG: ABC transporter ATP-binding protein [Clostridia bacterium]|nr:ABC transporter ATP-binding protein [Clostridia bacterium]
MINVSHLSFEYPKQKTKAIDDISFDIDKGEIFGFLGPSGAGKTTTQRLLIGLLRGYDGSVKILGKERRVWQQNIFEHMGVAFDFPNLYLKLSARENLNLISSYYEQKGQSVDELLERVGLLKDADKKVEGYSKGMKMRLNFIRSLLHNPDLLFLDEPTSGLDPVNAQLIKNMIIELKDQGKTIFLTTHNMTVADQLCDRVAFINEGQLSVVERPETLKRTHGKPIVTLTYLEGIREKNKEFLMHGLGENADFLTLLKEKTITSIHSGETTLEDIFIKLTGRSLK